jgi:hypothetical protein
MKARSNSSMRRLPKMNRDDGGSSIYGSMRRGKGMSGHAEDLNDADLLLPENHVHKDFRKDFGDNFNLDDLN